MVHLPFKSNKSSGFDGICAEHVKYGGVILIITLTFIFNLVNKWEYVRLNFRQGIQVPLFKGKNLCSSDTNNYRGITLLSIFSKMYEMVIWDRLGTWWTQNEVISKFQGACRKGQSCVHTSLLLQETVANALETHNKVFVSYFDVSKAFDTVWINGLFSKLHDMGIIGKLWRIMYRTYTDFQCRVRVAGSFSDWYPMPCGIHQGGVLSLVKYLIFIDELLIKLEKSKLCCTIDHIPSSPAGYADDLATATVSKQRTDMIHDMVYEYGKKWRFKFNASKSAVMVFGEDKKTNVNNSKYRNFRLGSDVVKEKVTYDHVGVKMRIFPDNHTRIEEKVSKGRKTLNASSGLGMRKNGLNMGTCNIIFWQVVVPTVTFGCEVWVMSDKDEVLLSSFQSYSGKRVQRFPQRAPNNSSFYGLGWLKLTSYVRVKKLLFVRSILKMEPGNVILKIIKLRLLIFCDDIENRRKNPYGSPIFDILNIALIFGVLGTIKTMSDGISPIVSKNAWSRLIWERAWRLDDSNWHASNTVLRENDLLRKTIGNSRYLSWWAISDYDYRLVKMCETMSRIICHSSQLKRDDYRLKGLPMSNRTCSNCDMYCIEDILHIISQCPFYYNEQSAMIEAIYRYCPNVRGIFEEDPANVPYYLLGREVPSCSDDEMMCLWSISGDAITRMYKKAVAVKTGIG